MHSNPTSKASTAENECLKTDRKQLMQELLDGSEEDYCCDTSKPHGGCRGPAIGELVIILHTNGYSQHFINVAGHINSTNISKYIRNLGIARSGYDIATGEQAWLPVSICRSENCRICRPRVPAELYDWAVLTDHCVEIREGACTGPTMTLLHLDAIEGDKMISVKCQDTGCFVCCSKANALKELGYW